MYYEKNCFSDILVAEKTVLTLFYKNGKAVHP